jgi:hypothetical protein
MFLSASVKDILIQPDIDGRRSKWIAKILEFDLEIKPTKLIKGQGLAKLLAESNCNSLGVNFIHIFSGNQQTELSDSGPQDNPPLEECAWYKNIIYFLQELKPPDGMGKRKARALKLKEIRYCLIDQVLYWKDPLGVLLRCLYPQETQKLYLTSMTAYVGDITSGKPQPTKFSGLGTTGLLYSLMSVRKSGLVSNARNSLERSNSSLCH